MGIVFAVRPLAAALACSMGEGSASAGGQEGSAPLAAALWRPQPYRLRSPIRSYSEPSAVVRLTKPVLRLLLEPSLESILT